MNENVYMAIDTSGDELSNIAIVGNDGESIFNKIIKSKPLNDALNAENARCKKTNNLKLKLKNTVDNVEVINLEREIEGLRSGSYLKKYCKMFNGYFSPFCFSDYEKAPMLGDSKQELISIIKDKNIITYDSDFLLKNIGSDILCPAKSIKSVGKRWVITKGEWSEYGEVYSMRCNGISSVLSWINVKHDITPFSEKERALADARGVLAIWKYLDKDYARRNLHLKNNVALKI